MDITVNPKLEHTNHGKTEQKQQNQEIREERVKYRLEGLTCAACAMKIEKAFCAEEPCGGAVFADVGVALIAVLNATRVRRYSSTSIDVRV